jgi:hypothetical protein
MLATLLKVVARNKYFVRVLGLVVFSILAETIIILYTSTTEQACPIHLAYNPSYSACFFSRNSIFSHKKSANSVF